MNREKHILVSHPSELANDGQRWVLALGTFDGMHRGHYAVIEELLRMAKELSARPAVLFFDPLPRQVLRPDAPPKLLTSLAEKVRRMRMAGVDTVVRVTFDLPLSGLSPADFLQKYFFEIPEFQLVGLCCGEEWRFGARNSGDAALLKELVTPHDIQVRTVPPVMFGDEKVSSSRIREAVAKGELTLAEQMLGRPYVIEGVVEHGAGIASSELHTPTANLADESLQLPPYGVYAAYTDLGSGEKLPGIVYIGDAPTIRGVQNGHPVVELHLFDFQGNLYGREIHVTPVQFLRSSQVFPTTEALHAQIQQDLANARMVLRGAASENRGT
ncbi:MAG: riboflavin biosynthesis protein RibF [Victivallales bacterium]|nr:riboflavin biosynthesis protein RibF [Victivallales bacterium]